MDYPSSHMIHFGQTDESDGRCVIRFTDCAFSYVCKCFDFSISCRVHAGANTVYYSQHGQVIKVLFDGQFNEGMVCFIWLSGVVYVVCM